MSKKPKQSRHRIPGFVLEQAMAPEPVDDRYQAEVDASMARLQRQFEKAQKAHAAALVKQERLQAQTNALAEKKAAQEQIAARRASEELRLTEYMRRIKEAAKTSRVEQARAQHELNYQEFLERRNQQTAQRQAALKAAREHERELVIARNSLRAATENLAERHRELKEIERLMMPGNYAGRVHRSSPAQHWAG